MNAPTLAILIACLDAVEPELVAYIKGLVARAIIPCHVARSTLDLPPVATRTTNCLGYCARGYTVIVPPTFAVEAYAFEKEARLLHVQLPRKLMVIGAYAFAETSIRTLFVPNVVSFIGLYAFACDGLEVLSLPGSMRGSRINMGCMAPRRLEDALGIDDQTTIRYRKQYTRHNLSVHDASGAIHSHRYQRRFSKYARRVDILGMRPR